MDFGELRGINREFSHAGWVFAKLITGNVVFGQHFRSHARGPEGGLDSSTMLLRCHYVVAGKMKCGSVWSEVRQVYIG